MILSITETPLFHWILIPLLVFLARILDVSVGTIRVIFVARGYRYLAPALGFIEVLIWVIAIGQIMNNLSNPLCYIAYASGFAAGNYIGIVIAERLSLGVVIVRVLTSRDSSDLQKSLKTAGFGLTVINGLGAMGPMKILFTIVPRHQVTNVLKYIKTHNPKAFYSIEEISTVPEDKFPRRNPIPIISSNPLRLFRKGK